MNIDLTHKVKTFCLTPAGAFEKTEINPADRDGKKETAEKQEKRPTESNVAQAPVKRRRRHVVGAQGTVPPPTAAPFTPPPEKVSFTPPDHSSALIFVPLFELCKLDTPLMKLPRSQESSFATIWARLFDEAVQSGTEASWSECLMFPKCILWAPVRGGVRSAKKGNMAAVVAQRLEKWSAAEKRQLWEAAVERSRKREFQHEKEQKKPQESKHRSEKDIVAALRQGDVKKALQMLVSAPNAPKTEATLKCLQKLHPGGPPPAPVPKADSPRFTVDVVRAALSSFGPTSASALRPR